MTYIIYDKSKGTVDVQLPTEAQHLIGLVRDDLSAEFAFEPMVDKVILAMNQYVADWLYARGLGSGDAL